MSGLIPEDTLERIRDATDIVDLISATVRLKRSGSRFMGLCPFHQEKTPSFYVTPERQRYKCFGCGTSGSAFDFVMEQESLTFPEACELLAQRAGVMIERAEDETRRPDEVARSDLVAANAWAADTFQRLLRDDSAQGCRSYLQERGIDEAMWEEFELGYAPKGWRNLLEAGQRAGFSEKVLLAAGLVKRREESVYDVFRDRLIFPIRDAMKRVIAFGGRSLDGSDPKYLNSPETPLFSKRRALYAVNQLRGLAEGSSILVMEGYTDVVMARQVGCPSAVATLGTSLTPEHARMLSRYGAGIVLVYDGDAAGRKAAERGASLFAGVDMDLRVRRLPAGEDPFDFLQARGNAGIDEIVEGSVDFFDFVMGEVLARHDMKSMGGKVRAAEELVELIQRIDNPVKQGLALERAASALAVSRPDLERRLQARGAPRAVLEPIPEDAGPPLPEEEDVYVERSSPAQARAERILLRDLLFRGGQAPWTEQVGAAEIREPRRRWLYEQLCSGESSEGLLLKESDPERRALINRLSVDELPEKSEDEVQGALTFLERCRNEKFGAELKESATKDDDALRALVEQLRRSRVPNAGRSEPQVDATEEFGAF